MPQAPAIAPADKEPSRAELSLHWPSHTVEVCGNDMILVAFSVQPEGLSTPVATRDYGAANQAVRALMARLQAQPPAFVADAVAGVTTLAVRLHERDQAQGDFAGFVSVIDGLARQCLGVVSPPGKTVTLHACFDPALAPDLEAVGQATGLGPRAVVQALLDAELQAEVVGFMPGFAYLGGLPDRLAVPRRSSPRPAVPAGSVAIAGGQAAVYPSATPGGWNLLGRCPDVLFDPQKQPPVRIALGDRVRFQEISRSEFEERWARRFR
ncbi:MAG: 5-oxoprolinase subunit B family protein [Burkholderiaceae bacterium]